MSTLAGTTWTFSTQGDFEGTIEFAQNGPSQNAGVATITATNPPIGCMPGTYQAAWAEVEDGNNFAVQFTSFMPTPYTDPNGNPASFFPPPLGIPTINAEGPGCPQLVTLFGQHTDGSATMFGTNFQTPCSNNHIMMTFNMTVQQE